MSRMHLVSLVLLAAACRSPAPPALSESGPPHAARARAYAPPPTSVGPVGRPGAVAKARADLARAEAALRAARQGGNTATVLATQERVTRQRVKVTAETNYKNAQAALKAKKYDEAARYLNKTLETVRWAPYKLGMDKMAADASRQLNQAKRLQRAAQIRQEQAQIHRIKAAERSQIERLRKMKRDKLDRLFELTAAALGRGEYGKANELAGEILREDPTNAVARRLSRQSTELQHRAAHADFVRERSQRMRAFRRDALETYTPYAGLVRFPDRAAWTRISARAEEEVVVELAQEAVAQVQAVQFARVEDKPTSTFSIDVDTASYTNVRQHLRAGSLPPVEAVRIEELINYFRYDYRQPGDASPIATDVEVAGCPWKAEHRVVRVGLQAKVVEARKRPPCSLVFLVDTSGSMAGQLALVQKSLLLLLGQLRPTDRVAIVVYSNDASELLESTRVANDKVIRAAIGNLSTTGGTNGAAGLRQAYEVARGAAIEGGQTRIVLCTDGDFNVGLTERQALVRLVEERRKSGVFLTVLGFGHANLKDSTLEALANNGDGQYAMVDSAAEARRLLVDAVGATLWVVARDVKVQLAWNPKAVAGYRLIGYETRRLSHADFTNDAKDAGEVGSGHTITALYEVKPRGKAGALGELRLRYKKPTGGKSIAVTRRLVDAGRGYAAATADFKFALAIAEFGELLRRGAAVARIGARYDAVLELGRAGLAARPDGPRPDLEARRELLALVRKAKSLDKRPAPAKARAEPGE